jgi:hypothetical protein
MKGRQMGDTLRLSSRLTSELMVIVIIIPALSLKLLCCGYHQRRALRGKAPDGRGWTRHAELYPYALSDLLATAVASARGWSSLVLNAD